MAKTLDFSKPHLLRNDQEYETALAEIEQLMEKQPAPFTPAFERLEFLAVLVEKYEEENFPIGKPTPQAMVDFVLEQHGLDRSDIAELMGGKARVSEFFNGKRSLSLNQVRALHEEFGIPTDVLIQT